MNQTLNDQLRILPGIDSLLKAALESGRFGEYPQKLLTQSLRTAVNEVRLKIQNGENTEITIDELLSHAELSLTKTASLNLRKVINATGVVLHTNLGRAPLSQRAKTAIEEIISGYSNLEYDLNTGRRGTRYAHVTDALRQITGAQDALVVNNNAAAILLVLSSLTLKEPGKKAEVIVSRGELVEIGGSFRIPDVLTQSGATLVEVGTTNKTRLSDYEKALTTQTAAILKVHTSNYRIIGFSSCPETGELAQLAAKYSLPLIEDLGSGTLIPLGVGDEPTVKDCLGNGADVVTFSGDKLLGAGQAGIILGKTKYISPLKEHPLLRAVRIDKLSLAALEGTLKDYQLGTPIKDIPVLNLLHFTKEELKDKTEKLLNSLQPLTLTGLDAKIVAVNSKTGGGALPATELESFAVAVSLADKSAAYLEERLRHNLVPIIARIEDNKIIIDVRCLSNWDISEISQAFSRIISLS